MTRKVPSARADERDYLVVELASPLPYEEELAEILGVVRWSKSPHASGLCGPRLAWPVNEIPLRKCVSQD